MKRIIKNNKGNVMIWAPVILIVLLVISASIFEYVRLNIIAQGTRDAVQAAITQVCTENYDQLYNGLREGYSGGYKLESISWAENIDPDNITAKLDAKLGTHNGEKATGSTMEYRISDLAVQIKNAPLAPDNPDEAGNFSGTATYTLTVPLSFGWQGLPPMKISMTAISGYSSKGDLSGSEGGGSADIPVTGINLNESELSLEKGDFASLAASVTPDDATDPAISWVSSNNWVCTVNSAGLVAGVNTGTATVLAISQGSGIAQCAVSVVTPVTSVSLNKANLTLVKGASETLTSTILPTDATNKTVLWGTSDSSICTVDGNGKVTAVSAGTAEIIVASQEGGFSDQCTVTVTIPVTGIALNKSDLTLAKDTLETLTASVYPDGATKPDVLWASSNSDICTVNQTGQLSALNVGTAIITATTKDGAYVAACTVTVVIPVTSVSLNKTYLNLVNGTSETLIATIWPGNATNRAVTWSSSNSGIAKVDANGKVSAVGVGTATIWVTSVDGSFTCACAVNVTPSTYTVTVNAVNGHVTGSGTYLAGSTVTINAIPDAHFHFLNWTNSSGTVIGTSPTYTIYGINADTRLTANFAVDMFTITVNSSEGGTAIGGGYFAYGSVITLISAAKSGYHFINWSDGNTTPSRNYTVTGNATLTANFKLDAYKWTYTISNNGTYTQGITSARVGDTYSAYTYISQIRKSDKLDDDESVDVYYTYTFTEPAYFKAGSSVLLTEVTNNMYSMNGGLKINGTDVGMMYNCHQNSMAYYFKSDTAVNSITVYASAGSTKMELTENAYVRSEDGTVFMLNNTGTSENQNPSVKYGITVMSSDTQVASNAVYFDDVTSYDDSGSDFGVQFLKPMDIDYVTFHANANEGISTYDLAYYDIVAKDVYGNSYDCTSYGVGHNLNNMWVWMTSIGTVSNKNLTFDMNFDLNGTMERNNPSFAVNSKITGAVDMSKVTFLQLRWSSHTATEAIITVHLKDGTSFNLNSTGVG